MVGNGGNAVKIGNIDVRLLYVENEAFLTCSFSP